MKQNVEYVKHNIKDLNDLVNESFGRIVDRAFFNEFVFDSTNIFIAHDIENSKIIGCAYIQKQEIGIHKSEHPTYVNVRFDPKDSSHKKKTIFPTINCLCRKLDDRYRGIGTIILEAICSYYKTKNINTIYLCARSERSEPIEYDINYKSSKYFLTNQKLLEYYIAHGFEIIENYYVSEQINRDDQYVHSNVMKKILIPIVIKPNKCKLFFKSIINHCKQSK